MLGLRVPFELKNPAGLWALGLLVPLVVLYLLKVRRQRHRVASTVLWRAAKRDLLAEHPFKRLVPEVPLLVQALVVTLLALALARPTSRAHALGGDHVAIVVDTSASMGAKTESGSTRIDEAREAAKRVVAGLEPGADALVIAAGREPETTCPLERDRARLRHALDSLQASDVEGRLNEALAIAAERLRALGGVKKIVLFTDGATDDAGALASSSVPVSVVHVGTPIDNTGIVRIDVRSGRDPTSNRSEVQVFALVAEYGRHARDVFVTLRQRNVTEPLASRKLHLEPGRRAPVVLAFQPAPADAGTGLVVELSPGDAMPADDRAYVRVPIDRHLPVVVAPAKANPWLLRALGADPDVDLLGVQRTDLTKADVPDDALVVCDGFCPTAAPGSDLLVVNPPAGPCRTATVGATVEHPRITSWSKRDPRLRYLDLDGVQIARARIVQTTGRRQSLVRTRKGTVIGDIGIEGHAGTLVAFDVGESNWPLKASFVLFVRNVVELARSHRSNESLGPGRTGEALRASVPVDVERVRVVKPTGDEEQLPARDGLVIVPASKRAGFFYLSWQGRHAGSALLSTNLTSERESDPSARLQKIARRTANSTPLPAPEAVTDYSWIAAALALLLLAFDAWWLTRTRQRSSLRLHGRPRGARA